MLPRWHILYGFAFSVFLHLFFKISFFAASIIFLSSFLIDVDHYLEHLFSEKDLSLKNAIKKFVKKRGMNKNNWREIRWPIFIFHGLEILAVLLVLSLFSSFFLWILIGFIFHLFLDILETVYLHTPCYSKISVIYVLQRNKNKKSLD